MKPDASRALASIARALTPVALAIGLLAAGSAGVIGQTSANVRFPTAIAHGFGSSMAVSGDEVFVGRTGEVANLPLLPTRSGGVHVFRRDSESGVWDEVAHLADPSGTLGAGFGMALAVEDELLAVGAPADDEGRGAVYLLERRGGDEWEPIQRLAGTSEGDEFGRAVRFVAGRLHVGATGAEVGGTVTILAPDGDGVWRSVGVLRPEPRSGRARFGRSLAAAGGRLLVGAPDQAGGAAYLFSGGPDAWEREAILTPGDRVASGFGIGIELTTDHAFVGAPNASRVRGAVFTFERAGPDGWRPTGILEPPDRGPGLAFGVALLADDGQLWVGSPGSNGGRGAIYQFGREGEDWVERGRTDGEWTAGRLGTSLAWAGQVAVASAPGADMSEGRVLALSRSGGGSAWEKAGSLADESGRLSPVVGEEARCEEGTAAGFDCADVDLVSFLPVSALRPADDDGRGVMLNDLWGWTDPQTGREYALVGRFDGTSFVDVTDPSNPVYLGNLPRTPGTRATLWRDIKVYADHAFIVSDAAGRHGVQVFDLRQLRDISSPPASFEETAHYDRIYSAHNIVINEETGFAYVVGASMGGETCGGALHMIDIHDPHNPTFAGCYADPATGNAGTGYTHDAQCVVYRGPDVEHQGREICFNASETALGIADVTDKANPTPLASAGYPNVGYSHQGWLSEDHRHFFLNDELDEISGGAARTRTLVWDVSDLDDPVLLAEHLGETGATDHNLYVRGRYMYQSNYVAGLRILDVTNPASPEEVAFFDTVPWGEDRAGFAGSWSNYPFFESGNILVTSMGEGLFVLKKREPELVP